MTPDEKSVIVANALGDTLTFIDPKTAGIQRTLRGVFDPYHLRFSPDMKWFVTAANRLNHVDLYRWQGAEAAAADIVLVALRWEDAARVLTSLPDWNGRIVIDGTNPVAFLPEGSPERNDPTNPLAAYGIKALDLGGRSSTDIIAGFLPGARVVKAFNHLDVTVLAEPAVNGGQRVLFYSGDDAAAKTARKDGFLPRRSRDASRRRSTGTAAVRRVVGDELRQDLT